MKRVLIVCTTDSMIWNFLIPHIKEMERNGYYVECASSITGDFYKNLVKQYNIKMNEVPFERSPYNMKNIKAYIRLCQLIKRKKFDTVFCHEPVGGAIGRLAGHKCKCKIIYMAHGFHFFKGAPKSRIIYYWVEKILSYYTDVLITINQEDYDAALKFKEKKCYKINGIGVDTSKFCKDDTLQNYLNKKFKLPDDGIKLLSVGELIPRKNHEVIIRALSKINNPKVYYFIAGDGELKTELEALIKTLNLEKNVFLLGYRTDIRQLCNSSDIFVMPSIHEGLSVALMEAMGCGKAIIASRIRGNVDLIDQGKGGYLCNTDDIDMYVKAIDKLVLSSDKRKQFGGYNQKVVEQFDVVPVKRQLIQILKEN